MADTLDERRFLRDIACPFDPDDDLRVTPTGDLQEVAGRDNLRASLIRRAVVSPGTLIHRPLFGGGLGDQVETVGSVSARSAIASAIRRSTLRDPRVSDCKVTVAQGTPNDSSAAGVTLGLTVTARGDETADPFTVSLGA